jgi:hypothetical protein
MEIDITRFFIAVPDGAHNRGVSCAKDQCLVVYFSHLERIAVDSKSQPCGKVGRYATLIKTRTPSYVMFVIHFSNS